MKEIAISVPTKWQSEAVQKALFEKGFEWKQGGKTVKNTEFKEIQIGVYNNRFITRDDGEYSKKEGLKVYTTDEFFANMDDLLSKSLMIGNYEVKNFTEKGFYVGCQFVSWDMFDKIAAMRSK